MDAIRARVDRTCPALGPVVVVERVGSVTRDTLCLLSEAEARNLADDLALAAAVIEETASGRMRMLFDPGTVGPLEWVDGVTGEVTLVDTQLPLVERRPRTPRIVRHPGAGAGR